MQLMPVELLGGGTTPPAGAVSDNYAASIEGIGDRISWWRFGETAGTTAADEEDTEPGEYKGGVSLNRPPLPAATDNRDVRLDGVDGHVEIAHNAAYEQLAAGTILIWFRLDSLNTDQGIFSKDAAGLNAGDLSLWYRNSDDDLRFHIQDGAQQQAIASVGALVAGQTYCAVMQWGGGGMKLYLASGAVLRKLGENAFPGGIGANNRPIYVGAVGFAANPPVPSNFAAGTFGDVVIWNRALSEPEIETATQATLAGYEQTVTGLNPAIYLKLDEASGATVADSSGNGRSGTITGTPAGYNVASLAGTTGSGNGGLNLGNAASISVPHATADTALTVPSNWSTVQSTDGFRFIGDCTVVCWFKPNALPGSGAKGVIFAKAHTAAPGTAASYAETTPILANRGSTVNGGSWEAYIDSAGAVHVEVRSFRGRLCRIRTPNGAVSAGTGYHLAVQLSYDGVAAWLNGAKFEDGYANALHVFGLCANIRGAVFRNNYPWTIGAAPWGGQSNIQVDEFAVYLRAPSATITQANINSLSNNVGTPAPLAHHIWGQREVNRSSFPTLQAAVDNVSGLGGGTVLVNGGATAGAAATYNESVILKSNVRIKKNPANPGHAQINGDCTCPQPTLSTLTDDASNFMTGDKTLDITNTRAVGDLVQVLGTQGNPVNTGVSPMRLDRRYVPISSNSNDANVPDGEWFEIESRTGSEITFVGAGSMFDFASANRAFVKACTPIRDVALEGDLRFTIGGSNAAIDLSFVNRARIIGVRGTTISTGTTFGGFAVRTLQGARSCQFRDVTIAQRDMQTGWGSNDGLSFYNGSIDCVGINCTTTEGRHGADVAGHHTFGPTGRCDFHNIQWINNVSRDVGGALAAFGIHGGTLDTIYWNCHSNWGGPNITGWKHDGRWMVCGETANAGGNMSAGDGAGDCTYRDIHIVRPQIWFGLFEGAVDVQRCHFENITRTANPTDTGVHENIYGSGANVNTYSNVDGPHASWMEV